MDLWVFCRKILIYLATLAEKPTTFKIDPLFKAKEVITPIKPVPAGVTIGQRSRLSELDVIGIKEFYGCGEYFLSTDD